MQRNLQRAGDGESPVVAPACKWPVEGVIKTIMIASISRREAYVSCHGYVCIQLSAQAEKKRRKSELPEAENHENSEISPLLLTVNQGGTATDK